MSNITTFFCVHDSDGILDVINTYYDDVIVTIEREKTLLKMMGNVSDDEELEGFEE